MRNSTSNFQKCRSANLQAINGSRVTFSLIFNSAFFHYQSSNTRPFW
jgi:hypothetical protein